MKNQEGQNPLELASADDVKCLLQEAMPSSLSALPTTNKANMAMAAPLPVMPRPPASPVPGATAGGLSQSHVLCPSRPAINDPSPVADAAAAAAAAASGGAAALPIAQSAAGIGAGFPLPHPGDGSTDFSKTEMVTPETSLNMSMGAFLASLNLESLREIFDREHINVEILADMGHEDLRQIGITAFGHR